MLHYIMFVILQAFYIEYCSDYLSSVIFKLIMYVCIYGVNNYCSSFTVLISFILSIVFVNLANAL